MDINEVSQLPDISLRHQDSTKVAKHRITPVNILEQFVKCHATDNFYPKFVKQQSGKPYFSELEFKKKRSVKQDDEFSRNLVMYDKERMMLSDRQKFLIMDICEDHEITTKVLLDRVKELDLIFDDVKEIHKKLETEYTQYEIVYEKEKE